MRRPTRRGAKATSATADRYTRSSSRRRVGGEWPAQRCSVARSGSVRTAASTRPRYSACRRILPMVIEIVDQRERIEAFLPDLDAMIEEGLVTLEKIRLIAYRHSSPERA
jgi:Uncharacterized ACR, COG1993